MGAQTVSLIHEGSPAPSSTPGKTIVFLSDMKQAFPMVKNLPSIVLARPYYWTSVVHRHLVTFLQGERVCPTCVTEMSN